MLKKLDYTYRHTSDPSELAKLANAQVRVAGALHVISEKQDRKHDRAIQDAQTRALTPRQRYFSPNCHLNATNPRHTYIL